MSAIDSSVRAWADTVVLPTYPEMAPDRNPMFLEKRVYQGSSGRVYPNRITDRVSDEREDHPWQAVHLENEYVRLMILPEIGGRIHVGQDRTNGYDFFYRQRVIKPALVGLLGPWISGGVEFNWPQHHRPSTFMPVDWTIEEEADGSRTVWLGEHEPMHRMKGMIGIRLRPRSSLVEARVRLANRTPLTQTFLFWANTAVHVHDRYQSFFPGDVVQVADHARRATSDFPVARGTYYGVDYGSRAAADADLSWYRNIPVPTSYMAVGSGQDFFGGYDHAAEAGLVCIADHRIAPGKKQWTWGNAGFGRAWDRNLTDEDGPYIELMSGVYTDNQPDFSFLAPFETRTFELAWYPIRAIGPATIANLEAAASLREVDGGVRLGVAVTSPHADARVRLLGPGGPLLDLVTHLAPDAPLVTLVDLPTGVRSTDLELRVEVDGAVILEHAPRPESVRPPILPAVEPPPPEAVRTVEELYLAGLHLDQYRHATRSPEPYWLEGLRRDPLDARINVALGERRLRAGEPAAAEDHFRRAVTRLTERNANPRDGEAYYLLGLALEAQGRPMEAEDAFAKAAWNRAWQGPAHYALAQARSRASDSSGALDHLSAALDAEPRHAAARSLRAALLRRAGDTAGGRAEIEAALAADPLDRWALEERRRLEGPGATEREVLRANDPQTALDLAHAYASAGLIGEAMGVLASSLQHGAPAPESPLVHYTLGWLADRAGDHAVARDHYRHGRDAPADGCFPARLEEIGILEAAQAADPADARAPFYLGNLYYDRRRYRDAISCWERARARDPDFATVHRNLGIAEANVRCRPVQARRSYLRAFAADRTDGRVLFELDQLLKRQQADPRRRLARLEAHRGLVDQRDDLGVEYAALLDRVGRPADAIAYLLGRRFHPWEGGEGRVLGAWVTSRLHLGRAALSSGDPDEALAHFAAALEPPESLGEARHPLEPEHEIRYELGRAWSAAGEQDHAIASWREASLEPATEHELSAATYFRGMALRALGDEVTARLVHGTLLASARRQARVTPGIDYFATSLPSFLLFDDDLALRNRVRCRYLAGLAQLGQGRTDAARRAFRLVLAEDADHTGALDALGWYGTRRDAASSPRR